MRTEEFLLDHQGKLFTVRVDQGQRTDISREHPEVAEELRDAVADWKAEMLPQLEKDDRPFVIAHPDSRFTQIPARDGIAQGGIQRSNRFPNCSYFTNWRSLEGKITWTAEVEAPGEYEVELYYTCPKADVGSEIELSFQGQSVRSRITVAHDPPVRGAEHDRVKRQESYVKEFRPLKMGTIRLKEGKGELTLKAISMLGDQVMEFRLIMLKRVE